jgi:hypothetical protein
VSLEHTLSASSIEAAAAIAPDHRIDRAVGVLLGEGVVEGIQADRRRTAKRIMVDPIDWTEITNA